MNANPPNSSEGAATGRPAGGCPVIRGLEKAVALVRLGRIISAIRHLERVNSDLTRARAMGLVESFRRGHESRWPEEDHRPIRCL